VTFPLQCKLLSSAANPGLRIGESDRKSALDQLKTDLRTLATTIKARWVCGQAYQQTDRAVPFRSRLREIIRGRSEELEALAVEMYARGLSTRDIEALLPTSAANRC